MDEVEWRPEPTALWWGNFLKALVIVCATLLMAETIAILGDLLHA